MKKTRRRNSVLLAGLLLVVLSVAGSSPLSAQGKNKKDEDAGARSVQGEVSDAEGNLVIGAVVQLTDTRTLQIRSFVTLDDGKYRFSGLKADVDYQVKAQFNGASSSKKTISAFDTRKVAVYNLKLEKK